ncbi:hypothetical protein EFP84_09435 [Leptospira kmetyi]|uniref:Uncharacterized protein n=1 Tax=Leptospira kmetyi TaxID=408139 RepID=A0A5F1XSM9_9LEPT|nr:hypothetical protein EFP84_09435 [Leptospira kmetyi]TGK17096.1 hypothetical protein EHO62_12185 [Leptospira kmetyi]TGK34300.1 hypothetical protein EHO66_01750 [Leptospira kmetyi]
MIRFIVWNAFPIGRITPKEFRVCFVRT